MVVCGEASSDRPNFDLVRLDTDTGEVEVIEIDPVGTGFMVGGAHDGTVRVHTALVGTWWISPDGAQRSTDVVLAGTNGGTIELRCGDQPGDCQALIIDLRTGAETPIDAPPGFTLQLSPRLDTYVVFGELQRLDGTVEELPFGNGGGFGEDWRYSTDGRFLTSADGTVFDIDGEYELFRVGQTRFADSGTLLVVR